MNTRTTHWSFGTPLRLAISALILGASSAVAQTQQRYYPPPKEGYAQPQYNQPAPQAYQQPYQPTPQGYAQPRYENPIQFLPKFGKRFSEVVRRIFYGQDPTGYDNPPQGYAPNGGYSLEAAPRQQYQTPSYPPQAAPNYNQSQPGYLPPPQQGQTQPRYNYPPQSPTPPQLSPAPTSKKTTTASSAKTPSASSSTRTYTPPKAPPPPVKKPAANPPPSTTSRPKDPAPDTPPPTTTRRSETTSREEPAVTSKSSSGSFLKGKKTAKPGRVISPYPPYKELDITGLESGSLALDPTTQKVFEVP